MFVCLHEYLHSFLHYAAYRRIHLQHWEGEDLISKEVPNMIHFEKQEEFMKVSSFREFQPAKFFKEFVGFNKFR